MSVLVSHCSPSLQVQKTRSLQTELVQELAEAQQWRLRAQPQMKLQMKKMPQMTSLPWSADEIVLAQRPPQ